jgi:Tol biopolymer transport system component
MQKKYKKSMEIVFFSHFLPLSDLPSSQGRSGLSLWKPFKRKIIFELKKDQSQDLDYYNFDF